jgi:hypothetical protein
MRCLSRVLLLIVVATRLGIWQDTALRLITGRRMMIDGRAGGCPGVIHTDSRLIC